MDVCKVNLILDLPAEVGEMFIIRILYKTRLIDRDRSLFNSLYHVFNILRDVAGFYWCLMYQVSFWWHRIGSWCFI